jgi:hypothetical protein
VTTQRSTGLTPVQLEIPDHWTPETALAVFELIDDLRDQIWSRYGLDIQDERRRQLQPDEPTDTSPSPTYDL